MEGGRLVEPSQPHLQPSKPPPGSNTGSSISGRGTGPDRPRNGELIAYRLTRRKFAHDLAGTGGLRAEGRCNHKGTPVIYTAQHVSLAVAEALVHLDVDEVPGDYVLVTIAIPDTVPVRRATPEEALALSIKPPVPVFIVPSVVVPQECNVVLYPRSAGFRAKVINVEPFHFDERLLRRLR